MLTEESFERITTIKILINDGASTSVRNIRSYCFIGDIFVITMLLKYDGGTNTIFEGCFLLFPRHTSKAPSSSLILFLVGYFTYVKPADD